MTDEWCPNCSEHRVQCLCSREDLRQVIVRLREALEVYGRHDPTCHVHRRTLEDQDWACDCGLGRALGEQP